MSTKMKRLITLLLIVAFLPIEASAQWYLFPNKKKKQQQTDTTTVVAQPVTPVDSVQHITPEDSTRTFEDFFGDFFMDKADVINVCMALPLRSTGTRPAANFIELYSGALIAARDLAQEGIKINLNIIDTDDPATPLSTEIIEDSDVVIGPVSYNDIVGHLPLFPDNKYLISPLEPKTAELVAERNIIQSPTPWKYQLEEMVDWLTEHFTSSDELIIIRDNANLGEQSNYLLERLMSMNWNYRIIDQVSELLPEPEKKYKVVIASDSDAFLTGAVRNLAIEAKKNPKSSIEFYCNSRIRSTLGNNVGDLYNINAHLTAAYHIDYDDPAVKDFILAYRSFFKGEPGSFAFQGYDALYYYVKMCDIYGRRWYKKLPEYSERGLQSDFKFDKEETDGRLNTAVRRVVYNSDFSTTLL